MAVDEGLANRVRQVLAAMDGVLEKKMFGGLAFLLQGNMCVGVHGSELIVRIDPAETEDALRRQGVRIFDLSGRPMKGWILVSASSLGQKKSLIDWVERGVSYAKSLPKK